MNLFRRRSTSSLSTVFQPQKCQPLSLYVSSITFPHLFSCRPKYIFLEWATSQFDPWTIVSIIAELPFPILTTNPQTENREDREWENRNGGSYMYVLYCRIYFYASTGPTRIGSTKVGIEGETPQPPAGCLFLS